MSCEPPAATSLDAPFVGGNVDAAAQARHLVARCRHRDTSGAGDFGGAEPVRSVPHCLDQPHLIGGDEDPRRLSPSRQSPWGGYAPPAASPSPRRGGRRRAGRGRLRCMQKKRGSQDEGRAPGPRASGDVGGAARVFEAAARGHRTEGEYSGEARALAHKIVEAETALRRFGERGYVPSNEGEYWRRVYPLLHAQEPLESLTEDLILSLRRLRLVLRTILMELRSHFPSSVRRQGIDVDIEGSEARVSARRGRPAADPYLTKLIGLARTEGGLTARRAGDAVGIKPMPPKSIRDRVRRYRREQTKIGPPTAAAQGTADRRRSVGGGAMADVGERGETGGAATARSPAAGGKVKSPQARGRQK